MVKSEEKRVVVAHVKVELGSKNPELWNLEGNSDRKHSPLTGRNLEND